MGTLVEERWAVAPAAVVQAGGQGHSHSGKGPGNGVGQNRPWKLKTKILRPESGGKKKNRLEGIKDSLYLCYTHQYT